MKESPSCESRTYPCSQDERMEFVEGSRNGICGVYDGELVGTVPGFQVWKVDSKNVTR